MTLASPADIATALRDWHLTVVARPGWATRGNGRPYAPIAQAWHHDALDENVSDLRAVEVMEAGRSDLPPPLCNGAIGASSTVYLIAYGQANHAGWNEADVLDRLARGLAPTGDARADPDGDSVVGNGRLWGWECRNAGDGIDVWDQLAAMETAGAALADACGWPASANVAHRELTARKIDPAGFDMFAFRADIARLLKAGPMPTANEIADAVIAKLDQGVPTGQTAFRPSVYGTASTVEEIAHAIEALRAGSGTVDVDTLATAVADELDRRQRARLA